MAPSCTLRGPIIRPTELAWFDSVKAETVNAITFRRVALDVHWLVRLEDVAVDHGRPFGSGPLGASPPSTQAPTSAPTFAPTHALTSSPTLASTSTPTNVPTSALTHAPTSSATMASTSSRSWIAAQGWGRLDEVDEVDAAHRYEAANMFEAECPKAVEGLAFGNLCTDNARR